MCRYARNKKKIVEIFLLTRKLYIQTVHLRSKFVKPKIDSSISMA